MNISTSRFFVVATLVLASTSYAAYKIGHVRASREGLQTLAFVSLWSVKPAVQVVDRANENPTSIPERIQVTSDGSILMVARYSMVFDPDLSHLHEEARSTLCSIAKNRELYRKRSPDLYDDALMNHLAQVHSRLKDSKAGCNA